jgi:hypothetical protein
MKRYWLVLLGAGLVLAAGQPPKTSTDKAPDKAPEKAPDKAAEKAAAEKQAEMLRATLLGKEKEFWEAWKRPDSITLRDLLVDGYEEIGRPGTTGRLDKAAAIKAAPEAIIKEYELKDPRVVPLGLSAALLTYRVTLTGQFGGKDLSAENFNVGALWVVRGAGEWLSQSRQWTPGEPTVAPPRVIEAFDANVIPSAIEYIYKEGGVLDNVRLRVSMQFRQGRLPPVEFYYGTWKPGEVKAVSLGFLAVGLNDVERIELDGSATQEGKPVILRATTRREQAPPTPNP